MPALMPLMYALAGCGQTPYVTRPSTSSATMAVAMASAVRSQPSRIPNERCAVSRIDVISSGGRKRLSIRRNRFRGAKTSARGRAPLSTAIGLLHNVHSIDLWLLDRLHLPGRPPDDDAVHGRRGSQTVVNPPLVLRTEAARRGDFLHLLTPAPVQLDAGAERASVIDRKSTRLNSSHSQ